MRRVGLAAIVATYLLVTSCALQQSVPDPARVEEALIAARAEERELVRSTIREPERVTAFLELLDERDSVLERFTEQVAQHRQRMASLNADYRSERQDFEAQLEAFNRQRADGAAELFELIAGMKRATTAEEWQIIASFQTEKLDLRQVAYRHRTDGG